MTNLFRTPIAAFFLTILLSVNPLYGQSKQASTTGNNGTFKMLDQLSTEPNINVALDNQFFLLGTLSDYMGREKYPAISERVDRYYPNKKKLAFFLISLFEDEYPDLNISTNEKTQRFEIHSKNLSNKIDEYYTYENSGTGVYNGKYDLESVNLDSLLKSEGFYQNNFDSAYVGRIKSDIFKTEVQKLSFIAGEYVKFGAIEDSVYQIRMFNSVSKAMACVDVLKHLDCNHVEYTYKRNIPGHHRIQFTPTDELKNYITTMVKRVNRTLTD